MADIIFWIALAVIAGVIIVYFRKRSKGRHKDIPLFIKTSKEMKKYLDQFPKNQKYIKIELAASILKWPEEEIRNMKIAEYSGNDDLGTPSQIIKTPFDKNELDKEEFKYLLSLLFSDRGEIAPE